MNKLKILSVTLLVIIFSIAIYLNFYGNLPEKMASHWGISGEIDGYTDRFSGLFLIPILSLIFFAFLSVLPKFDPLKKNYVSFQKEYDGMITVFVGFMGYLYLLTILTSMGFVFDFINMFSIAFAGLFYYMAILLSKAKQNWFVGIKTPWTLNSKLVWDKTHAICSKLFKAVAIVSLLGVFFKQMLFVSVMLLLAVAAFSFVYSYVEFNKEKSQALRKKKK